MNRTPFSGRLFDALASLRLAVVVMITLAGVCSFGTFYEMSHGTPAAQRDVYQTWWFALLLGLLGTVIFCAMMKRYPWKSHHTGFVMAHIGILTLLAGSLVSLHWGLDANMPIYEGETSDRVSLLDKALQVALPGHGAHGTFYVNFEKRPPGPGREQRFPIPGSDITLVAEDFEPHVELHETYGEGPPGGRPALYFVLESSFAKENGWLLADDPERAHLDLGPASVGFHAAADPAQARELAQHAHGRNQVSFVALPDGSLTYGITTRSGPGAAGPVEVGKPVQTPWMGMTVTVERLVRSAVARRRVTPAPLPEKDDRRLPAVKVRLDGPSGRSESDWVHWTETRNVRFLGGQASLAYRAPQAVVPFRVTLLDFKSDKYPGSNMAATYESQVRIDDPERGVSEHLISMNHPLHYRGYIFFQASFVEGEPMMSIFSVARAPGLPLVYLGVALISLGVAWMFYVKPYLARRLAARALEAQRQREKNDEAQSASAVPPSRPAEPARSGA